MTINLSQLIENEEKRKMQHNLLELKVHFLSTINDVDEKILKLQEQIKIKIERQVKDGGWQLRSRDFYWRMFFENILELSRMKDYRKALQNFYFEVFGEQFDKKVILNKAMEDAEYQIKTRKERDCADNRN